MSLGLNIKHLKTALNVGHCLEVKVIASTKQFRSLCSNEETWACCVHDENENKRYNVIYTIDKPSQKVKTIVSISELK